MFVIDLNKENYEYDVNALVKAFFPGEMVHILTPESRADRRETLLPQACMRVEAVERGEHPGAQVWIDRGAPFWKPACGKADVQKSQFTWRYLEPQGSYKDAFKRFFYGMLCELTEKTLPWGNLVGIRPTKLAYRLLEEGKGEEEILRFLQDAHFVSQEKARLSIDIARREQGLLSRLHYEGGYSLYVGIPFCPTTCLYCSFTSYPIAVYKNQVERYLRCLFREMEFVAKAYRGKILDSVYIGGGTPTTLEPAQLDRLLTQLRELFDFTAVKEFTVEAGRADSITREKLEVLRRHGVSRISVNPQTMKQETLDMIGRKASVEQVAEAFGLAREAGFDNINMDLILGLPGEEASDVRHTVDRITELAPDSLTVHSLAIKRASKLNQWVQENGVSMLNNTDETMGIAAEGAKRLGMVPYYLYRQKNMSGNFENVGYAKPDRLGLYNILIMEEVQSIVALGAGSITKLVLPDGRIERSENLKEVKLYMEKIDEMIERKRKLFAVEE